jgi:Pyridoxamine 5'-phosphate oxidase
MRTGEGSAARQAAEFLAEDVVLIVGPDEIAGRTAVQQRITGQWPMTPVYYRATWSRPVVVDHQVTVEAASREVFAPIPRFELAFSFDDAGRITRVEHKTIERATPLVTETIPDFVKTYVNNALANGTPMVIACTNPDGSPNLTLRGATQVFSDTQLSVWLRHAEGDTVTAIQQNPQMAALYRDSRTRTTLIFHGRGHVEASAEMRNRAFDIAPEVEQNHDPRRLGAALIIDIDRMDGMTAHGTIQLRRNP